MFQNLYLKMTINNGEYLNDLENIKQMINNPRSYLINYYDNLRAIIDLQYVTDINLITDDDDLKERNKKDLKAIGLIP